MDAVTGECTAPDTDGHHTSPGESYQLAPRPANVVTRPLSHFARRAGRLISDFIGKQLGHSQVPL